jgi:hypothetical protein
MNISKKFIGKKNFTIIHYIIAKVPIDFKDQILLKNMINRVQFQVVTIEITPTLKTKSQKLHKQNLTIIFYQEKHILTLLIMNNSKD